MPDDDLYTTHILCCRYIPRVCNSLKACCPGHSPDCPPIAAWLASYVLAAVSAVATIHRHRRHHRHNMHHRRHRHHRHHRCPPSRARLPRRIARLHSAMQTPHTHLTRTSHTPHTHLTHTSHTPHTHLALTSHTPHTHLTRGLTSTIPHTPAVHLVQGFHAGERRPSPS